MSIERAKVHLFLINPPLFHAHFPFQLFNRRECYMQSSNLLFYNSFRYYAG